MSFSRPVKIIDLDVKPRAAWRLEENAVHLVSGELWKWQKVGCILCIMEDESNINAQTLVNVETGVCKCLTHGDLEEVKYQTLRTYKIRIGDQYKTGSLVRDTVIHMPINLSEEDKTLLIENLISECVDSEREDFNDCDSPEGESIDNE